MPEDAGTQFFVYGVAGLIALAIFYYLIKSAVKNAILEAREAGRPVGATENKPSKDDPYTPAQIALIAKYEKNEISMEAYKAEWEKLK